MAGRLRSALFVDRVQDLACRLRQIVSQGALKAFEDGPASIQLADLAAPKTVAPDFFAPKLGTCPWYHEMPGTTVPEAPIYEHDDLGATIDEVGAPWQVRGMQP